MPELVNFANLQALASKVAAHKNSLQAQSGAADEKSSKLASFQSEFPRLQPLPQRVTALDAAAVAQPLTSQDTQKLKEAEETQQQLAQGEQKIKASMPWFAECLKD